MYHSLSDFINVLELNGELIRITSYVDPVLEIAEVTDRVSKQPGGGKALLFENTGTQFPVLMNLFGSEKRICIALGMNNLEDAAKEIQSLFHSFSSPRNTIFEKIKLLSTLKGVSSFMPVVSKKKGKCQEIIDKPELSILPVLKCWPEDGGKFVTLPMVNTVDPSTGVRNVGMYRMQIFSENTTGMHWHRHKTGARHFSEYKKLGKKMPITVTLGGDPVYTYAATAPLPDGIDEYIFAGFLRRKRVELVKSLTNDILIPSDVDIVIEGYIDPEEEFILEGPFGDHTGFYSLADLYPKFHVTCITHRKNAVYPATIVGIPPQEDAWIAKATERIFLAPVKIAMLPEVIDWDLPVEGVAHNLAIVRIDKTYPGQAFKVMNALWGAGQMMFNKIMIVVDKDIDVHNYHQVNKIVLNTVDPKSHIVFQFGPYDVLDHAAAGNSFGGKMGIDATRKLPEEIQSIKNHNPYVKETAEAILKSFSQVTSYRFLFIDEEVKGAVFSVNKNQIESIQKLAEDILPQFNFTLSYLVLVDDEVDIVDSSFLIWICTANIDPSRDCHFFSNTLVIDATSKVKELAYQNRHWPNVIVSDEETISRIDSKWDSLKISSFLPSPSLKYRQLKRPGGAYIA